MKNYSIRQAVPAGVTFEGGSSTLPAGQEFHGGSSTLPAGQEFHNDPGPLPTGWVGPKAIVVDGSKEPKGKGEEGEAPGTPGAGAAFLTGS